MPEFEITHAHRWRDIERVEADEMRREGNCLVFTRASVVVTRREPSLCCGYR